MDTKSFTSFLNPHPHLNEVNQYKTRKNLNEGEGWKERTRRILILLLSLSKGFIK